MPARANPHTAFPASPPCARVEVEVAILAGGRSRRMGTDKSRLRLGRRTLLGHVREAARATGWTVRVIRRDLKPGCGPVGGIHTALKTSQADIVLFLACDMPLVTTELLRSMVEKIGRRAALFCDQHGRAGFPFVLRRNCLTKVEAALIEQSFSLQQLALRLRAGRHRPSPDHEKILTNVNTPDDWFRIRAIHRTRR